MKIKEWSLSKLEAEISFYKELVESLNNTLDKWQEDDLVSYDETWYHLQGIRATYHKLLWHLPRTRNRELGKK